MIDPAETERKVVQIIIMMNVTKKIILTVEIEMLPRYNDVSFVFVMR